jgi:RNA polymerase sigma-70 factor (ECF subfamily)
MEHVPEPTDPSRETNDAPADLSPANVARWVRDYADDLHRFLARRRFIESDIKDVCQEVYLRLLRFDRPAVVKNPAAYLFRVAANVAHDYRLRQPKWIALVTQDLNTLQSDLTAEEIADSAATHRALFQALEKLPALPRAALAMQAREDISLEEIARRLGTSRRAVRKAITRGHELMRAALYKDF